MEISVGIQNEDGEICTKADNTVTIDRISQLPEDILSFILSFLNMKSAAKARVLSWRWRYVCASSSNLEFDIFTIFGIKYDRQVMIANRNKLWEDKFRFVKAVDQFLQLYKSSKLSSFTVNYPLGKESAYQIDKWISLVVEMKTEKLELDFTFIPEGCELYSFPCHLVPQGSVSQLKHLCLHKCKLELANFTNCFNSLISLDLFYVQLDQSTLSDLLSGCINLELLKLTYCRLPGKVSICGRECTSLRKLILSACQGVWRTELSNMNLKTFEYVGATSNLRYVDIPSLENLHLCNPQFSEGCINYVVNGLAKDHPHLQTLILCFSTPTLIPISTSQFSHLKELELFVHHSSDFDLLSFAILLNACPCLQKFHLALQRYRYNGPMVRTKFDTSQQINCNSLKKVEIGGFHDKCNALELAKYLLNNVGGLEQMIITKQIRQYRGDGRWFFKKCPKMEESEKKWIQNALSITKVNSKLELVLR